MNPCRLYVRKEEKTKKYEWKVKAVAISFEGKALKNMTNIRTKKVSISWIILKPIRKKICRKGKMPFKQQFKQSR